MMRSKEGGVGCLYWMLFYAMWSCLLSTTYCALGYKLIMCVPRVAILCYTSTWPKIFHCLKHIHIHLNICCTHVAKIYSGYIMRDFIMRFLKSIDIVRSDFLLWYTFEHSQLIDQLESRQYPNRVLRHWLFS